MTTATERVDKAVEDAIAGGTRDRELNEHERRLYDELAARIRKGDLNADGELWRLDYARVPPDLRTFVLDDYYLGRTLRPIPGENEGIWPTWLTLLMRDFDLGSYIHNAVVTGSIGTGKTLVSVVLLLYRVCIATCLKNPQHFFGISRGSRIVYNFLSVTKEAVKDTAFGDAMNMMGGSPYFTEVCGYNPDSDYSGFRIPLANQLADGRDSNIWITAGSKGQHLIGRNVVGVVLDEGNFRLEKDPDLKAYALYDAVRTRISNRFQKLSTFLPALCLIASSAADESSFTEKVVSEIETQERHRTEENLRRPPRDRVPQTQLIYRNSVYQIKRHLLLDIGPDHHWFKVAHGLKNMEPYILEGWYREDGTPVGDGAHEEAPSGARTELVPKFYWDAFRRNCRTNLQSLSGISTSGAHRLFASTIDIEWCLAQSEAEGLKNPVIQGVERMAISNEDSKNVWDFLVHSNFVTRSASRHLPLRHPDRLRYAHVDLATQNLCGVAICHLVGAQIVEGLVKDGLPFSEYRLVIEYDFILTICAGATKPISIDKIQRFFFWLRDMCGFQFGLITADMFQCLVRDTRVDTGRGLVPIQEVKSGDIVASKSGPRRVKKLHRYTNARVLRIVTNHGETVCGTPNHRIEADQGYRRWKGPAYRWTRLDELKTGDVVHLVTEPVCVQSDDDLGLTESQAEWLGLFWANGCACRNNLNISVHEDDVADSRDLWLRAWNCLPCASADKRHGYALRKGDKNLAEKLKQAGFEKPSVKCKNGFKGEIGLPEPILRACRPIQAAFLRGLFSGDGNVGTLDGCITFSTKHKSMAEQIAIILRTQFGIPTTRIESEREGFGKTSVQQVLRTRGPRRAFAEKIGFIFKRKQNLLQKHLELPGRNLTERVERIEHGIADVYDLEVEDDPSYTANGFVSHNSTSMLQMLEAKGFKTDLLSIDKNKSAYTAWRTGFEERRIRLPRNAQMLREAEALLEMDKKFDHPEPGSKDSTDAAAGSYLNAINSEEKNLLASQNVPTVATGRSIAMDQKPGPLVDIPIPERGYTRTKQFDA